jgi:N-acetylglucosaminyldiphosphoundecaprenol N-acetyl-beta-D-mannosaminyltransferase
MATQTLTIPELPREMAVERLFGSDSRPRVELADLLLDRVDLPAASDRIRGFLQTGRSHQIVTVNLDFLRIAQNNDEFRQTVNSADLVVADGMPLVWASRLGDEPLPQRITGHDLIHECAQISAETGHGFFLLGAEPGVAEKAAKRMEEEYPGLRVVGTYAPSFEEPGEDDRMVAMIDCAKPGFLLVALGAPRQDLWIHNHRDRLSVPVCIGVGCVFDMYAGEVKRAPNWLQSAGLEWTFRLAQEPRRLWRRYIVDDMPMFGRLMLDAGRRAFTASSTDPPIEVKRISPMERVA